MCQGFAAGTFTLTQTKLNSPGTSPEQSRTLPLFTHISCPEPGREKQQGRGAAWRAGRPALQSQLRFYKTPKLKGFLQQDLQPVFGFNSFSLRNSPARLLYCSQFKFTQVQQFRPRDSACAHSFYIRCQEDLFPWKDWLGVGTGCSEKWRSHQPWRYLREAWMWCLGRWFSGDLVGLGNGWTSSYGSLLT